MMVFATQKTEIPFQLNFVIIILLTGSKFISDQGMYNNRGHQFCLICAHILQHLPVPVRCTHQSMPIIEILSTKPRETVPTVETIQEDQMMTTSTVMVHNLD